MSHSNASRTRATGQKFIARNRAPRVQIEYDVETYGSERTVEIPFVMGVIADLVGKQSLLRTQPMFRDCHLCGHEKRSFPRRR